MVIKTVKQTQFQRARLTDFELSAFVAASVAFLLCFIAAFAGCGEDDAGNSQPVIEAIPDQSVDLGKSITVETAIRDDIGDLHDVDFSIDPSSTALIDTNLSVSSSSSAPTRLTLTIKGVSVGFAIITVTASDNSGHENADAEPMTFEVTVVREDGNGNGNGNGEYKPLQGLVISDGKIQFLFFTAGRCIEIVDSSINGVTYTTHTSKWQRRNNASSSWVDIPGTEVDGKICSYSPARAGQYRIVCEISIDGVRGKYTSENILEVD